MKRRTAKILFPFLKCIQQSAFSHVSSATKRYRKRKNDYTFDNVTFVYYFNGIPCSLSTIVFTYNCDCHLNAIFRWSSPFSVPKYYYPFPLHRFHFLNIPLHCFQSSKPTDRRQNFLPSCLITTILLLILHANGNVYSTSQQSQFPIIPFIFKGLLVVHKKMSPKT